MLSNIGPFQLLIVLVIVLAIFGTKRLRTLGSDLGSAVKGFRSAVSDADKETSDQIADQSKKRLPADPDADLPSDGVWCLAFRPHPARVHASKVVPDAERDPVLALVPTAAGAEDEVMIVQAAPCRADRDRTAPAIPCEHRVPVTRLPLPFGLHVQKE